MLLVSRHMRSISFSSHCASLKHFFLVGVVSKHSSLHLHYTSTVIGCCTLSNCTMALYCETIESVKIPLACAAKSLPVYLMQRFRRRYQSVTVQMFIVYQHMCYVPLKRYTFHYIVQYVSICFCGWCYFTTFQIALKLYVKFTCIETTKY